MYQCANGLSPCGSVLVYVMLVRGPLNYAANDRERLQVILTLLLKFIFFIFLIYRTSLSNLKKKKLANVYSQNSV